MPEQRKVEAAGGVLFRRQSDDVNEIENIQVLLMLRRGVWDLPKGKIEEDESPEQGACREVEEETGCRFLRIVSPMGTTIHQYEENGVLITKKTWWYAMQSGEAELKPQQEEEIEALEWTDLARASEKVAFDNLRDVLERFSRYITAQ